MVFGKKNDQVKLKIIEAKRKRTVSFYASLLHITVFKKDFQGDKEARAVDKFLQSNVRFYYEGKTAST